MDRRKPRVLFVTEKWHSTTPEFGLTNASHYLVDTLIHTRYAKTIDTLYGDEWFLTHGEKLDSKLLSLGATTDIIIYSWVFCGKDDLVGPFNPDILTWKKLKEAHPDLKQCAIWWDSCWGVSRHMFNALYSYFDLHINIDYTHEKSLPKVISLWTPQSPDLYFGDPLSDRPIPVAHAGRLYHRPERRRALVELENRGIKVHHAGGQTEDRLTKEAYAQLFRDAEIMLDFTPLAHKGRAWETTLSGALLVASELSQINLWFIPGVEYITYKMLNAKEPNFDDLANKIRYYSTHVVERKEIAYRGYKKATERYSFRRWWDRVLTLLCSKE